MGCRCGWRTGRARSTPAGWPRSPALARGATTATSTGCTCGCASAAGGSLRQVVETAFAHLCESFGLQYPGAHTRWGLMTPVAAKLAAYNLGIWINRSLGRPDFAFATLIV